MDLDYARQSHSIKRLHLPTPSLNCAPPATWGTIQRVNRPVQSFHWARAVMVYVLHRGHRDDGLLGQSDSSGGCPQEPDTNGNPYCKESGHFATHQTKN